MFRVSLACLALASTIGCSSGPTFTNLGNGVLVPSESIEEYAAARGISRVEARTRMRIESDQERVKDHAEEYGISLDEAKRQLEYAHQQRTTR